MFEAAEVGRKIAKEEYKERVPLLRQELISLQQELRGADFPVIVVFAGVDGAGKSETVNLLNEWMDPRWILTRAYVEPSEEEGERPPFWRYWRDLPPRGRIGLFLRSWYSAPALDHAYGRIDTATFEDRLDRIVAFEKALADDGALILKFLMHLSKDKQKQRLKKLEKDPLESWRVTETDWRHWRMYDSFIATAEQAILRTSTGQAPWHIVEGYDHRYRSLTVGVTVRDVVRKHMERRRVRAEVRASLSGAEGEDSQPISSVEFASQPTILSTLASDLTLESKEYRTELRTWQGKLNLLQREARDRKVSTMVVFEGWDAAGKGSAIRRCTAALDARWYDVLPYAAPNDEERAHHYLWRFWRGLGRAGRVTFFDRSWYGRVLVERVEGFASEAEWMRAYKEINDFELELVNFGIVLVKLWIHITPEEQLARFKAREETPWKQWKVTDEDWRNREKWDRYEQAVNDMIARTSTRTAPWTLVEGNDKRYARVKILRTLCERLGQALGEKA